MSNYVNDSEEWISAREADPSGGQEDSPTPDEFDYDYQDYWWNQRVAAYKNSQARDDFFRRYLSEDDSGSEDGHEEGTECSTVLGAPGSEGTAKDSTP